MKETAMVSVNPVICLVDWNFVQLFVHSSFFWTRKSIYFFPFGYNFVGFFLLLQRKKNFINAMKTFISPESWFSIAYPDAWFEFEGESDAFLFYNPDEWNGNFRISAYRGEHSDYGRCCMDEELRLRGTRSVQLGRWRAAQSEERFREDGEAYVSYCWTVDAGQTCVECSFTTKADATAAVGEQIVASMQVNPVGTYFRQQLIPVRLVEMVEIDEAVAQAEVLAKKLLKARFNSLQQGVDVLQRLSSTPEVQRMGTDGSAMLGLTLCSLIVEEVEGFEWRTWVDGTDELPVMVNDGQHVIHPLTLFVGEKENTDVQAMLDGIL